MKFYKFNIRAGGVMKYTNKNLKCLMVVQQLEDEYWPQLKNKNCLAVARSGDIQPLLNEIKTNLEQNGFYVRDLYGILHDKDSVMTWDEENKIEIEAYKAKHIHILIKLEKGGSLNHLALIIGVEPQFVEKAKSGRYGYDNLLAYLVHAKDKSKYQYKPNQVVTAVGEDYSNLYERQILSWLKGRATKEVQATKESIDFIISEILSGRLTKNHILLTDDYYSVYGQNKRRINEAFDTYYERKAYKTIEAINNQKFKKTVFFITAPTGYGKTKFGKELIKVLKRVSHKYHEDWADFMGAATNAFDEYNGEEIMFLDDIRGETMIVSDWLKLLDPYTISPISARYHNKFSTAKVIIVTSSKTPYEFFYSVKNSKSEDFGQFFRRIDYVIEIGEKYKISVPVKNELGYIQFSKEEKRVSLYDFSKFGLYEKNYCMDKLVKKVIKNVQW